jgi:MFS family permease
VLNRVGARPLTAGGLLVTGVGLLEIAFRHGTSGLLVGLAVAGLGLGTFTPANNATIMSASPKGHTGVIGGVLNMTRGVGTALGVALASALYITASGANSATASPAAAATGLTVALATLGLAALTVGLALLLAPATAREATRDSSGERWRTPRAFDRRRPHGPRAAAAAASSQITSRGEVQS